MKIGREKDSENAGLRSNTLPDLFAQGHAWSSNTSSSSSSFSSHSEQKKKVSQQPEISANGDRDPNQVNEEIEANIQITREIESEILKCSESEEALAARESDLTKTLYVSQFEINTLLVLTRKIFFLFFFSQNFLNFDSYA